MYLFGSLRKLFRIIMFKQRKMDGERKEREVEKIVYIHIYCCKRSP
jgi:hypothetical protein